MVAMGDSSGTALAAGRFAGSEPLGFEAGDSNLYRFVANGPTEKTDPSGLYTNWCTPDSDETYYQGNSFALAVRAQKNDTHVDLGWLSGWLSQRAQDNRDNPLVAIPAGTLVGPAALLDGTVIRGIRSSACESRKQIRKTIANTDDPIQKAVGFVALGYGYAGEGFAIFGAAEGAYAPIQAGIGLASPALPPSTPIQVTHWGPSGMTTLRPYDWVQIGRPSFWNYIRSGKWQPGEHFALPSNCVSTGVSQSAIRSPPGWEVIKYPLGQRIYVGPTVQAKPGGGFVPFQILVK